MFQDNQINNIQQDKKVIYCGNCGKKNHTYNKCYKPIMSLGVICIQHPQFNLTSIIRQNQSKDLKFDKNRLEEILKDTKKKDQLLSKLKFLMICRKHTVGFIEIVCGNFKIDSFDDLNYIKKILNLVTKREFELIIKAKNEENFDLLWDDLWYKKKMNAIHEKKYNQAKNKFLSLVKGVDFGFAVNIVTLDEILKTAKIEFTNPPWEFPKGRRNLMEQDLDCAKREFEEETNFNKNEYHVLDLKPMSEIFMGNNGMNYQYVYYIAESLKTGKPSIGNNIHQKTEISDIKWLSFDEAMENIRVKHRARMNVLTRLFNSIYYNLYNYL